MEAIFVAILILFNIIGAEMVVTTWPDYTNSVWFFIGGWIVVQVSMVVSVHGDGP